MTRKLDDASWHYGGDFPSGLEPEAGATHIGMFFAWMIQRALVDGKMEMFDPAEVASIVAARSAMPGELFRRACDEKLLDDDFTDEGAAFAHACYSDYMSEYDMMMRELFPTAYHAQDSWETFDRVKPLLDKRFDEWKRGILKTSEGKK